MLADEKLIRFMSDDLWHVTGARYSYLPFARDIYSINQFLCLDILSRFVRFRLPTKKVERIGLDGVRGAATII